MKTCANCGRRITAAEWRKLPVVGHMCMPEDADDPEAHLEYRNCRCRSTLIMTVRPGHTGACTLRTRKARDPVTPLEARARAKTMFRELTKIPPRLASHADNPEFFERAAVLADVVLQSDRPEVGEALALAVRGRVTPYSGRFINMGIGAQLPSGTEATELDSAIMMANRVLFPPRQAPCLPNRSDLRRLVVNAHGEGREARNWLRTLWREMEETCAGGRASGTLDTANSAIRGHGVESMVYRIHHNSHDVVAFDYVNTGDTYNETVGFVFRPGRVERSRRFLVTTLGDVVEQTERRFKDQGEWRRW